MSRRSNGKDSISLTTTQVTSSIVLIIIVVVTISTTLNYDGSLATGTSSTLPNGSTSTSTGSSAATMRIAGWSSSLSYPTPIWTQSCVTPTGEIVCIGGLTGTNTAADVTNAVYYAAVSSSGQGPWNQGTGYPLAIREESCVTSSNLVYCVGGYTTGSISASSYYAPVTSSGVGQWSQTTSYPFPVWGHSCAASQNYIYCVGGITGPSSNTSSVYYAPLSSSGIGQWAQGTSYPKPIYQESCVTSSNLIYCIGGLGSTSVYYATTSSSGLSQWSSSTSYPSSPGLDYPSCVTSGGTVYCIGGYSGPTITSTVYSSPISASGVGAWKKGPSYPVGVWAESCVVSGGTGYCIGGESASGILTDVFATSPASGTQSSSTVSTLSSSTTSSTASGGLVYYKGTFTFTTPLGPSGINDSSGKPVQWNSTQMATGTFTFWVNPQNYTGKGVGQGSITVTTQGYCAGSETVDYTFTITATHVPGGNLTVAFENSTPSSVMVPLTCQGSTIGFYTANNPIGFLSVWPNLVTVGNVPETFSQPPTGGTSYTVTISPGP